MKDSITKDDLYALILMLKAGHDGAIVVLESENDCRGLDSFIDSTNCQTIPGHGKENGLFADEWGFGVAGMPPSSVSQQQSYT